MSLEGTWKMTHKWSGQQPYSFSAVFNADGTVTVSGGFFGTWTVLGSSSQVSIALASCSPQSITSYAGNVLGPAMGGEMTGAGQGGPMQGIWTAIQQDIAGATEGDLRGPGE